MTTNLQDKFKLYISIMLLFTINIGSNAYGIKVLASVNKMPITDVDLDQRIALLEKLNVIRTKDAEMNQIKVAMLRNMTDEKVIISYIKDYLKYNKIDINIERDTLMVYDNILKKLGKQDSVMKSAAMDYAKSNSYITIFNSIIVNNINIKDDEIERIIKKRKLEMNDKNKNMIRDEIIREKYPDKINKAINKIKRMNYIDIKS